MPKIEGLARAHCFPRFITCGFHFRHRLKRLRLPFKIPTVSIFLPLREGSVVHYNFGESKETAIL